MTELDSLKERLVNAHHNYDIAFGEAEYGREHGDVNDLWKVEDDLEKADAEFREEVQDIEAEVAKLSGHQKIEWGFWLRERWEKIKEGAGLD